MSDFERVLSNGIPQQAAADFFIRIKKAGWADPPDETGALEGQFAAPIEGVVSLISQVAAEKFKLMVAYHVFAESMRGLAQHAIGEVFHEHAEHERAAAEAYLKRAAVLGGGPVHLPEILPPPASSEPVKILMALARAEQEAIQLQTQLKQAVGETNPLGFQIEQYMIEDMHHLDELWQMMPQDVVRDPVIDQAPAGAAVVPEQPTPEQAAPAVDEASAKTAFSRAIQKLAGTVIPFPGKTERMIRSAKGALSEIASRGIPERAAVPLGMGAAGAMIGGASQLARSYSMDDKEKKRWTEKGGPVTELAVKHPLAYGAGMGALSLGGGALAAQALAGRGRPGLTSMGGLVGAMAPGMAALLADRVLKDKTAAFRQAMKKLALQPMEPGPSPDAAAPTPDTQPMVVPQASMEAPGVQPPMATEPGAARYAPVNYLEAEQVARAAQADNEASFYRNQAEQASMQAQDMSSQLANIQAQIDQLTQQSAESQSQIMAANEEAVRANDQMLNQATLAARMRMGMQTLRAQMMEVASQDPEQLAAAAGGPTPMDVGTQAQQASAGPAAAPDASGATADPSMDPGAQPGTPGASADPGAPPGSAPGGAGGPSGSSSSDESSNSDGKDPNEKKDGGETTVSIKKGSVLTRKGTKVANIVEESMKSLPAMAAGGIVGAGAGYLHARRGAGVQSLQARVDELKGQSDSGFGKAVELAQANLDLAKADESRRSPLRSALVGGLVGAGLAGGVARAVPEAIDGGKRLINNIRTIAGNAQKIG